MDQDQTGEDGALIGSGRFSERARGHADSSGFARRLSWHSGPAPTRLQVERAGGEGGHREAEGARRGPASPPPPIG